MMLEMRCNISKLCDYESAGPDIVVDQKHCLYREIVGWRV